ncbi:MAG TPA: hypothetical protein VEV17_11140 [Bryobacteraceae bacterium]|nr:hypothetical protein [Bryobacteraceae bacterium]
MSSRPRNVCCRLRRACDRRWSGPARTRWEGLAQQDVRNGENILIADSPRDFAAACLALLEDAAARRRLATVAWELVAACYSWDE